MAASSRRSPLVPALAGLLVSLGLLGAADNEVNVQFHAFQDTRGVTVLSPAVDLDKDFTDRTGLRLRFGVDAISAASDSCARCHQEGASNQRTFFSAAIRRKRETRASRWAGSTARSASTRPPRSPRPYRAP